MSRCTIFILALVFCVSGLHAEDAKKSKLEGTWKVSSIVRNGAPQKNGVGDVMVFEKNTVKVKGKEEESGTFKLDETKKPVHIDLIPGNPKHPTVEGIVEVTDDTIKICIAKPKEAERPKKFEAPEGSNHGLIILKRVKQ